MATERPGGDAWWERAVGVVRASPRTTGRTLRDLIGDLDRIAALGFDVLEVFAPCHGGTVYEGLDVIDFYAVDPVIGSMDDFVLLVREAHQRGIAVIPFLNLGYVNASHPSFIQACDDRARDLTTDATRTYIWADSPDERIPYPADTHFLQGSAGRWHWSDRARSYYWVKWDGENGDAALPQLNWGDPGWRAEAARILAFWRAAGADGFVLDAVNWYIGCDWPTIRELALDAGARTYAHPEGAGGFGDEPAPWITEGGFTVLLDYSLRVWWEGIDVLRDGVASGSFEGIEEALVRYRDVVDAVGGICYLDPPRPGDLTVQQARLAAAIVASAGELYYEPNGVERMTDAELGIVSEMLRLRRRHPALAARGPRVPVSSGHRAVYTFVRGDGPDRVLVALNFSETAITTECGVPGAEHPVPVTLEPLDFAVVSLP